MPNLRRIFAGIAARSFGHLLADLSPGDITWLARNLFIDRDAPPAVALTKFSRSYYELFHCNSSGDLDANGETELIRRLSGVPMKIALDVGANIGSWTAAMKMTFPLVEIHAFEIIPETLEKMRTNLQGLSDIRLNEYGLGDEANEIDMWFSPDNDVLTSSIAARLDEFPELANSWRKIRCKIMRGDEYISANHISHVDFLKIDVEGMEMRVLSGFEHTFARDSIDIVQFEYGPLNKFIPLLLKDLWTFFDERGFVVGKVYPKGVAFKNYDIEDENFVGLTYIACRKERTGLIDLIGYR